jgi:beta-lactamase class A
MFSRRSVLGGSLTATALLAGSGPAAEARTRSDVSSALQSLETGQSRLGVCLLDTVTGEHCGVRMEEHFALSSTFKLAMVGACLREADAGRLNLDETIPYERSDLLSWAPVTQRNLSRGGMRIVELAQAAQEISDGTAANLLVRRLGGPAAVTRMYREMGDPVTRLDRYEPMLGMVLSADLRDTTSPFAMAQLVRRLTTGDLLSPTSRERLLGWMVNTGTGPRRIRAGLPNDWRTGNKTGTGRDAGITNKCNDIAITFPPGRAPVIICAYYDSGEYTDQVEDRHQAVLADVARVAARWAMS